MHIGKSIISFLLRSVPSVITRRKIPYHHFAADRQSMLNSLVNILPQQHQILLNIDTKGILKELTQILVFGLKENQALDIQIFTIVSVYNGKTGRFI